MKKLLVICLLSALMFLSISAQSVKVYRASLNQTGTSAPSATVFENNFDGKIAWVRIGYGSYQATSSENEFTAKTFLLIGGLASSLDFGQADFYRVNNGTLALLTRDVDVTVGAQLYDNLLYNTSVEIRVYP